MKILKRIYRLMAVFGFDPVKSFNAFRGVPAYVKDLLAYRKQQQAGQVVLFPLAKPYPCLSDRYEQSGVAEGHYFHQDLLVARRVFENSPETHVDIGSRIDGFVAHVAAFRKVQVVDIRPLESEVTNISFMQADLMEKLDPKLVGYCDSLSCLHALEHFGLGRYGDPINSQGYLIGFENFHEILRPQGKLYFSVPIGPQRLEFNAHRVFSVSYLLELFADKYHIERFSFVDNAGQLHENVEMRASDVSNNFGCHFGCGIFELAKV